MKTIGEKLFELRESKGMTQEDLSDVIKVSRQTISHWELNITSPSSKFIQKLCLALDVDANYFIAENAPDIIAKTETAICASTETINSQPKFKPLKIATIISGCVLAFTLLFTIALIILLEINTEDYPESTTSVTVNISYEFFICIAAVIIIAVVFIVLLTLYLVKSKNSCKK